jgi:hypothetical protein
MNEEGVEHESRKKIPKREITTKMETRWKRCETGGGRPWEETEEFELWEDGWMEKLDCLMTRLKWNVLGERRRRSRIWFINISLHIAV